MAPPERSGAHPITAHYSFIDLERMKDWVGLVGWPCSGRFTYVSGHPSAACRSSVRQGKFAGHRPMYHATNHKQAKAIYNRNLFKWHNIINKTLMITYVMLIMYYWDYETSLHQNEAIMAWGRVRGRRHTTKPRPRPQKWLRGHTGVEDLTSLIQTTTDGWTDGQTHRNEKGCSA